MDFHVFFKMTLLNKSAFTDFTTKRPLHCVEFLMSLLLDFICKTFITVTTAKWSIVNFHVPFKMMMF